MNTPNPIAGNGLAGAPAGGEERGGSWMDSLGGIMVRVLGDMGLTVRNLVVKLRGHQAQALLACDSIRIFTAADDWRASLAVWSSHLLFYKHIGCFLSRSAQ
jgi:hypothetical protein